MQKPSSNKYSCLEEIMHLPLNHHSFRWDSVCQIFGVWRSTGGPQVQVIVPALGFFLRMCWYYFSSKQKKLVLPSLVLAAPPSRSILCFFRKASLNIIVLMPPPQQEPEHESLDRFYRENEAGWPCDQEGFARLSMFEGYKGPFIIVFSHHLGNMFFVCELIP